MAWARNPGLYGEKPGINSLDYGNATINTVYLNPTMQTM
jgi:hypothetical protein